MKQNRLYQCTSNEEIPKSNLIPAEFQWENFYDGWVAIPGFSFAHFFLQFFFS